MLMTLDVIVSPRKAEIAFGFSRNAAPAALALRGGALVSFPR